jgi:hypothetical protein
MAQRHEAHDSLDHFPTPPWATRALCEWLRSPGHDMTFWPEMTAWEPACAEGHMSRPLAESFGAVISSDVHDYGFGEQRDFLFPGPRPQVDWIITNPPFRLGQEFARTAIERAEFGAALLVRTAFLEGGARHAGLFLPQPPAWVLQFVERVPMVKGRLDGTASTATSYCWIVWHGRSKPSAWATRFGWLAPCRKRLERPGDYDAPEVAAE